MKTLACVLLLLLSQVVVAGPVSFSITSAASGDIDGTYFYKDNQLRNHGAASNIRIDSGVSVAYYYNGLVRFLTLVDSITAYGFVSYDSIKLVLYHETNSINDPGTPETVYVAVSRCLRAWVEGDNDNVNSDEADDECNWAYWQYSENAWTTGGGTSLGNDIASDRDTVLRIVANGENDAVGDHSFNLDTASFAQVVASNNGWLLYYSHVYRQDASQVLYYTSDEGGTAANRPELYVWGQAEAELSHEGVGHSGVGHDGVGP